MGDSLGGADLVHFGAFTRQDARNQNRTARVVAQGIATVDQLGGGKFEGHGPLSVVRCPLSVVRGQLLALEPQALNN